MIKVSDNIVFIPVEGVLLSANLSIPQNPKGLVIFSHGSGSSRHSPRNQFVAKKLNEKGLATLMADLLTINAPKGISQEFEGLVDEFICLHAPAEFFGVGAFYEDFSQVEDVEVISLLQDLNNRKMAA